MPVRRHYSRLLWGAGALLLVASAVPIILTEVDPDHARHAADVVSSQPPQAGGEEHAARTTSGTDADASAVTPIGGHDDQHPVASAAAASQQTTADRAAGEPRFSPAMREWAAWVDAGRPVQVQVAGEDPVRVHYRPQRVTTEDFRITTGGDEELPSARRVFTGRSLATPADAGPDGDVPQHSALAIVNDAMALSLTTRDWDYRVETDGATGELVAVRRPRQALSGQVEAQHHDHHDHDHHHHAGHVCSAENGIHTVRAPAGMADGGWQPTTVALSKASTTDEPPTAAAWVDHPQFRLGPQYDASLKDIIVLWASSKSQTGSSSNLSSRAAFYFTVAARCADTYERQLGLRYLLQELVLVPEGSSATDPGNPGEGETDLSRWRDWLDDHRPQITYGWGHAALWTKVDGGGGGVIGRAFVGRYGTSVGVSVQERNWDYDVHNHELGHNVGALHSKGGVMNSGLRSNDEDFFKKSESGDFTAAWQIYDHMHDAFRVYGEADLRHPEEMPFGVDDDASTPASTPVTIEPLANDLTSVPYGAENNLRLVEVGPVFPRAAGTAIVDRDTIRFVPASGFTGNAWFSYTLGGDVGNEGRGWLHAADVVVTVGGADSDPDVDPTMNLIDDHIATDFQRRERLNPLLNDEASGWLWAGDVDALRDPDGSAQGYSEQAFRLVDAVLTSGDGSLTIEKRDMIRNGSPVRKATGYLVYEPGTNEGDEAIITYTAEDADGNQGTARVILTRTATLGFDSDRYFLSEPEGEPVTITIARSAGADTGADEVVHVRASGSARLDGLRADCAFSGLEHFDPITGIGAVRIPAGASSTDIVCVALEDGVNDGIEWVDLVIQNGSTLPPATIDGSTRLVISDGEVRYQEDFDERSSLSEDGWSQATDDGFDWRLHSGRTISNNTGPDQDHTSGYGQYIYTESGDSYNLTDRTAVVIGPAGIDVSGLDEMSLSFWYHMFGDDQVGTIAVAVAIDGGSFTDVWSRTGPQSSDHDDWKHAVVDLSSSLPAATLQVRISASLNQTIRSDMAIDDIAVIGSSPQSDRSPSIAAQPQSQALQLDDVLYLAVAGDAFAAPSYQWFHDGSAISGATGASYHIDDIASEDAGTYYVEITSASETITSGDAIVSLGSLTPPSIMTQPSDQSVNTGVDAQFAVVANGSPTLTYQWFRDGSPLSDGGRISGAQAASLTISDVTVADAGDYTCEVGNGAGDVTSDAAQLSVRARPTAVISADPTTGEAPLSVSFDAGGSSDPDGSIVDYQWDFGNGSSFNGQSTSHTFDGGSWTVTLTVTDDEGLTHGATVDIVAEEALNAQIAASPANGTAPLDVAFTGTASGGNPSGSGLDFASAAIDGYSDQDKDPQGAVEDGGRTLHVSGNSWKRIALPAAYTVTAETLLRLDVRIDEEAEIIAVGLDDDDDHENPTRVFQIGGSSNWGLDGPDATGGSWTTIEIAVGSEYTGSMSHFCVVADDDASAAASIRVRDVQIFEDGETPGYSFSWDFDASDGIGADATGATANHTFGNAGDYTVTLTVSDGTDTATDTVMISVAGGTAAQRTIAVSTTVPDAQWSIDPSAPTSSQPADEATFGKLDSNSDHRLEALPAINAVH